MEFTLQQQAAIDEDNHTLVTACPGAGKTRVIIERAARLLQNRNNNLAMVTFTRAAAFEMQQRLRERITTERAKINTFHKFAILQFYEMDSQMTMASNSAVTSAIWSVINILNSGYTYEETRSIIEELNSELYPKELKNIDKERWDMYRIYRRMLEKQNLVDLSEVFRMVVLAIREGELSPLPVTHLLVDEFQDSDAVQLAWVEEHVKRGINVTVVGDDDQSVYAFRKSLGYAGIESFLRITQATVHKLETCFRCPQEITDHAGLLINENHYRMDKNVYSYKGPGGEIVHVACESDEEEAEGIVNIMQHLSGTTAVLARRNLDLDEAECHLAANNIPYQRTSSQQFWLRQVVSMYLQLLVTITHPSQTLGVCVVLAYLKLDNKVIERYRKALEDQKSMDVSQVDTGNDLTLESLTQLIVDSRINLNSWKPMVKKVAGWLCKQIISSSKSRHLSEKNCRLVELASQAIISLEGDLPAILKRLQTQRKDKPSEVTENVITLCTFHSSKGLEFDNVWLVRADCFDDSEMSVDELEEERRLFYVAMTRSKERLYISTTQKEPSRFLFEAGLIQLTNEARACIN